MKGKNWGKWVILYDIVVICFSLMIAWIIRSRFSLFFYRLQEFIFLFPWIIITRTVLHFFFGIYSFTPSSLNNKDIKRLIEYNIFPSIILLILRFFQFKNNLLRMPLSMITMEYGFSVIGFISIRIFINSIVISRFWVAGYVKRIVLWAEIYEIEKLINFEKIGPNLQIMGILNQNPLFWNTDFNEIRVYGNESDLYTILAADDRISAIAFTEEAVLNKKQKKNIIEIAEKLNLEVGCIKEDEFYVKTEDWLKKL